MTLEDLNRVARKYLSQFLRKDQWYLSISCHVSKVPCPNEIKRFIFSNFFFGYVMLRRLTKSPRDSKRISGLSS